MADELKFFVSGTLRNGDLKDDVPRETFAIDQTTAGLFASVEIVPTTEEVIPTGDVATLGWLWLRNLDATNFVEWGPESGGAMVPVGRLKPGMFALLELKPGITLRWKADTAAARVHVKLYEA